MRCFHAHDYVLPLPSGHRFPMAKYAMLREALALRVPGLELRQARAASDAELHLVHEAAYVEAVIHGRLTPQQVREIGLPWSAALVQRSRHSVGATLEAAQVALFEGRGVAANLAGGTHHAHADRGAGYCVFNDVAVAARALQGQARDEGGQALRVLVVDLDVHQGDGTASIFAGDDSVFTLSLHGQRNYPARKATSDLDIALPDGCDDGLYLGQLRSALDRVDVEHRALPFGLAFYLAGADPHADDRLGRLALSAEGLAHRDEQVLDWLAMRRIPMVMCMAGGYGRDLATTVAIQCRGIELAAQVARRWTMEQ